MSSVRPDQFSGCLVGQCLGDALGAPIEGQHPAGARGYVHAFLRTNLVGSLRLPGYAFGQYTDDSQLARELMQSYVACGGFQAADYARRVAAIFTSGRIVGPGAATSGAAFRLAKGVPWEEAGTQPPSAGNGSAMRAAPIGLFFFDKPDRLIEAACDQGQITHQDPRCSAGAVAIAGAVAMALQCETIDAPRFLTALSEWTGRVPAESRVPTQRVDEPSVAQVLLQLNDWLALPPEEAAPRIAGAGLEPELVDPSEGITPFVTSSVCWSLYAFLRTPDDYWETICTAISPGGDVDTTAAMAGAISGAHLGLEALPAELARRVTDQGTWGYDELVVLAELCYQILAARPRE